MRTFSCNEAVAEVCALATPTMTPARRRTIVNNMLRCMNDHRYCHMRQFSRGRATIRKTDGILRFAIFPPEGNREIAILPDGTVEIRGGSSFTLYTTYGNLLAMLMACYIYRIAYMDSTALVLGVSKPSDIDKGLLEMVEAVQKRRQKRTVTLSDQSNQ